MKEILTTEQLADKQQFDRAFELLREATTLYRKAATLFNDLGIECYSSNVISKEFGKEHFGFYKGIRKVAKLNGTELITGNPIFSPNNHEYLCTNVDGVLFYTLENKDEKTV